MVEQNTQNPPDDGKLEQLLSRFDEAIELLDRAPEFAKAGKLGRVFDTARRVLMEPGGCGALEARAAVLEQAGGFAGSDWASPETLVPALTPHTLASADANTLVIEALSELRLLSIARVQFDHATVSAEHAHHFLTQVLASNLALLFSPPSEAERETQGRMAQLPRNLLQHLAALIGYQHIIDQFPVEPGRQFIVGIQKCDIG